MRLAVLAFVHGPDESLITPWRAMVERTYPGCKIILANDGCDTGNIETIPNTWAIGAPRAVRDSLQRLARDFSTDWIIKTDVDVAHLKSDWLNPSETAGKYVIGFQQTRQFPWGFKGGAYAIKRRFLPLMVNAFDCPTCPCHAAKDEDCAMSLAAYIADPLAIHLHRHDPLGRGLYADWNPNGCKDANLYARRFNVVHCGTMGDREQTLELMQNFESITRGKSLDIAASIPTRTA